MRGPSRRRSKGLFVPEIWRVECEACGALNEQLLSYAAGKRLLDQHKAERRHAAWLRPR